MAVGKSVMGQHDFYFDREKRMMFCNDCGEPMTGGPEFCPGKKQQFDTIISQNLGPVPSRSRDPFDTMELFDA